MPILVMYRNLATGYPVPDISYPVFGASLSGKI